MDASYIPIAEARGFTTHWIKAAQLLQANSEQKLKMIEKPAEEAESQGRKHWWQRWRD